MIKLIKESFSAGYKMYLQEDNGGWGLLYTDGDGNWFYMQEYDLPIDFGNNAK